MSDDTRDLSAVEAVVALYEERCGSGDPATTAQDLLTDLMHYASREKFHLNWDAAWNHYAEESGRCHWCGQTEQEVIEDSEALEEDEAEEFRNTCGGHEDFTGDVGPHKFEWDDIEEDRRRTA